jgi:hypothetical protein
VGVNEMVGSSTQGGTQHSSGSGRTWLVPLAVAASAAIVVGASVLTGSGPPPRVAPEPPDTELQLNYTTEEALESHGESVEGHLLIRHHCLFLQTADGPVDVAWPAGYSASAEAGTVVLRGVDNNEVARVGDWVRLDVGGETSGAGLGCGVGVGVGGVGVTSDVEVGTTPVGWPSEQDFDFAHRFAQFAGFPQTELVRFFPAVQVGVGRAVVERLVGDEVLDRDAWWLELNHAPNLGGQVSALSRLLMLAGDYRLTTIQRTCTGGADVRIPRALERYRVLSYEPSAQTPCSQWYAVDVYLDDADNITAVMVRR